jgi:hypothetical protein
MATAGYSGTPLVKKLGIREGARVLLVNAPGNYRKLVAPLPQGVRILSRAGKDLDVVHIFADARSELERRIVTLLPSLAQDGMIWVSWPKKASKVPTDITEGTIRDVALPLGLVDVKVCAVDDTWSGLKLVIRKELRKSGSRR